MASQTEIINLALMKLGQSVVVPNMEDRSKAAQVMMRLWPHSVSLVLGDRNWPFAMRSENLALDVEPAEPGWSYRYALPTDCVRAIAIVSRSQMAHGIRYSQLTTTDQVGSMLGAGALSWELSHGLQQTTINANVGDGVLIYQGEVTDTRRMSPHFVEALACRLAADAAPALIGDSGLNGQAAMIERYKMALTEAGSLAANQSRGDETYVTPSVAARGY